MICSCKIWKFMLKKAQHFLHIFQACSFSHLKKKSIFFWQEQLFWFVNDLKIRIFFWSLMKSLIFFQIPFSIPVSFPDLPYIEWSTFVKLYCSAQSNYVSVFLFKREILFCWQFCRFLKLSFVYDLNIINGVMGRYFKIVYSASR